MLKVFGFGEFSKSHIFYQNSFLSTRQFSNLSGSHSNLFWRLGLALFVFSIFIFFSPNAHADQVTLAWDASSGADGYRLFYRQDGQSYNYSSPVWEGVGTIGTIDLDSEATHYLVIRAYNAYGESGDSNEASITIGSPVITSDLDYIGIEGPIDINENSTLDYNCRAYYTDGTSRLVEPDTWNVGCASAEISATGLLTTYDVGSDQACQITASYTEGGITSADSHDVTIRDSSAPPPLTEIIIDDGDPGTSWTGTWELSVGENYFGEQSVYAYKEASATYTFAANVNGYYDLLMWWAWYYNRCSSVLVDIYDDNTLIDTLEVNQKDQALSGMWNHLGAYWFNGNAKVVINGQDNNCSTCADAVMFVNE